MLAVTAMCREITEKFAPRNEFASIVHAAPPMSLTLMNPLLAKTPLYDWHLGHQGRMVDFAGWSMPVQYESIVAEHQAVRSAVGLFDISHMGRLAFSGAGAARFLDSLLTRRVSDMQPGQIRYSLVTNDAGGILDDVLLYRLEGATTSGNAAGNDDISYLLVVNASNRQKILDWIAAHLEGDVICSDETFNTAMIAVQGPAARRLVCEELNAGLENMRYYYGARIGSSPGLNVISRTGYTGEDGFELIVPAEAALGLWEKLLYGSKQSGARPVGLGARDTLRLEAAMPLYGHELSESIDPITAGLDFAVNLENRQFPGRDSLARIAARPREHVRVGLELSGKRVPREGFAVRRSPNSAAMKRLESLRKQLGEHPSSLDMVELVMELEEEFELSIPDLAAEEIQSDAQAIEYLQKQIAGAPIGNVTSGTFSPTLQRPIAMGYVRAEFSKPGTELAIDIRGQMEPARVAPLPFYRRPKKT